MVNFKIGQKVKCIKRREGSNISLGEYYTIYEIFNDGCDDFIRVFEIDNGDNAFFAWRFAAKEIELNNNIKIL